METYPVTACSDTRYRYNNNDTLCQDGRSISYTSIGLDIEPAQMAKIYQNTFLPRLASDLAAIGLDEEQNNLWSDTMPESSWSRVVAEPDGRFKTLRPWLPSFTYAEIPTFFVASLRTNSTTGVLREHLMRFNSSVQCEEIDKSSFPSPCPGENPFVARLQKTKDTDIRVCVPGSVGTFPWRLSRNRQDITEELYLDLWDGDLSTREDASFKNVSATVRCEAKTTRGYFEMGNALNEDTYGPLLDQWPGPERMQTEFNDYVKTEPYKGKGFTPSENDTWAGEEARHTSTLSLSDSWKTSGPLASSAMAMFGNTSWLHNMVRYGANTTFEDRNDQDKVEWDLLCAGMPYGRLFGTWSEGFPSPATSCKGIDNTIVSGQKPSRMKVLQIIHEWIEGFAPARRDDELTNAVSLLQISLYVSNRALLTFYSPNSSGGGSRIYPPSGRAIYTAPGQAVQKPAVSVAAVVVLSLLIGFQLIGLAFLACYIYRVPTWTGALDARAMARIGACIRQGDVLPPIGAVTQRDRDVLKVDGLVGIGHDQVSTSLSTLAPDQRSDRKSSDFCLQPVGGKNNI
ncbi:hypothetical protein C7974DRAFT_309920 [Boeremia exigua]|uniref:uncharacterized protein n=1 Tax=Boeremia exigua TaxID=749465 RepID=UPI001E8E00B8|nr:uncharacterized protein C7974DRAFT_309920 [Boeremia exigua]KAH6633766.1 hypothetical protein C7974DRAFT_309920 [Boeremia exigua]